MLITKVHENSVIGSIQMGSGKIPVDNCKITFTKSIMRIEYHTLLADKKDMGPLPLSKFILLFILDFVYLFVFSLEIQ